MAVSDRRTGGRRETDRKRIRSSVMLEASFLQSGDSIVTIDGKEVEAPRSDFGADMNQHHMAQLTVSEEGSVIAFKHH